MWKRVCGKVGDTVWNVFSGSVIVGFAIGMVGIFVLDFIGLIPR